MNLCFQEGIFDDSAQDISEKLRVSACFAFVLVHITDKKENKILLIYKEIQKGAVAKSYMRRGFLIYMYMRKCVNI